MSNDLVNTKKIIRDDGNCQQESPLTFKAYEQNIPVVLFIMVCKLVLTSESVNGLLECDHMKADSLVVVWLYLHETGGK